MKLKPWAEMGLVVAVALTLGTLLAGCGGDPGPEDTVQTHFDALSAGDSEKLASVFIPEAGESLSDVTLPEITIENLDIEKVSETEDTAEVTAEYDAEITINDKPTQAHAKVKFTLIKADGEWLISNSEEILIEVEATVLVYDEAEIPIAGAEVTISNAQEETLRTATTNGEGLATFGNVPAPDGIVATKSGYSPSRGWGFGAGEPYKVRLDSFESLRRRNEHSVQVVVDPPFLSISQGGSATAKVSVSLQGDFQPPRPTPTRVPAPLPPGTTATPPIQTTPPQSTPIPAPPISLESNPAEVTLPDTGQADIMLTLRVAPGVEPGIYKVTVMPQVLEDSRAQGVGEGYGTGGATLKVKVKGPE